MSEIKVTEENPQSAKIYTYDPNMSDDELEVQLPKPVGYRVLVAMPEVEKTFDGTNVLKTDAVMHNEHIMSIIGMVLDMGDQAYNDKEKKNIFLRQVCREPCTGGIVYRVLCKKNDKNIFILRYSRFLSLILYFYIQIIFTNINLDYKTIFIGKMDIFLQIFEHI